ncbi:tetratricopeptide repeat protein [Flavobacterium macrobrachii]|jgi:tetratricopeptide (TPR) repeat protein|uniref:tetratricopeptide repeat protein n=1 Tax=Flavobacterium macrobrachii TaxID=591204 RepID=UPI0037C0A347
MKTVDKYLFQALDNYPYWLEGTIESLDYALSYNDKNPMTLCLYGRIQTEQLHDYEEAKRYFQEALAIDIQAVAVYPFYIDTLLLNEDYEEADKLIAFALTIKGINKVEIMLKKVLLLEKRVVFKKAFKDLKEIKLIVTNNEHNYQIEEIEKRLKAKKELVNSKKNKKTTGKKNKGKE